MKTPFHILETIQKNKEKNDPILDLRDQSLLEVPEEIRELSHLKLLLLGKNVIQVLPSWLNELPNIEYIQLNMNPLNNLGDVENLVIDWGVWWRLRDKIDPQQVAGLWLRWEEGEMLDQALALPICVG